MEEWLYGSEWVVIVGLIGYVITSIGLYRMSKKLELENSWFSWIPYVQSYQLGKIAGDTLIIFNNRIKNVALIYVISLGIYVIVNFLTELLWLFVILLIPVAILVTVFFYFIYYKVCRMFVKNADNANVLLIVSIFLPIVIPFVYLILSANEPNLGIYREGWCIKENEDVKETVDIKETVDTKSTTENIEENQ